MTPVFAAAGLFVLFKAWHGWRLGLVRQLAGVAAVLAALIVGYFAARIAGPVLAPVVPFPEKMLGPVGGAIAGFATYLVVALAGMILFKRTSEQSVLPVRLLYGTGGAILGAAYAVLLLAILGVGVRLTGTLAETKLAVERLPYFSRRPAETSRRQEFTAKMAALKRQLDDGPFGGWLRRFDPVSPAIYTRLGKAARLAGDRQGFERLLGSPEVRPLLQHPKVAAMFRDAEVARLLNERKYLALLTNARVVAAVDDPEVMARLRVIAWDRALDQALRGAGNGE